MVTACTVFQLLVVKVRDEALVTVTESSMPHTSPPAQSASAEHGVELVEGAVPACTQWPVVGTMVTVTSTSGAADKETSNVSDVAPASATAREDLDSTTAGATSYTVMNVLSPKNEHTQAVKPGSEPTVSVMQPNGVRARLVHTRHWSTSPPVAATDVVCAMLMRTP